jgi:SAM-dependent methyltransferase
MKNFSAEQDRGVGESPAQYGVWREQRKKWDTVAQSVPDFFHAHSTQYYRRCEIAMIERCIGSLRGKKVLKLDLWNEAINTRILHWMRAQGAEAFGLDVSSVITGRAHRNSRNSEGPLHLVNGDIRHLPFESGSFDFVYTMGTIEHIDEYQAAVDEIQRVLRAGGRAIVGVPHKWNVFLRPLLVRALELFGKYPYSPEKSFSSVELRGVVENSGLSVKRRTGILAVPGVVRMADLFLYRRNVPLHHLTPLFLWPFDFLETRCAWPGFFGYLIALVVEKPD